MENIKPNGRKWPTVKDGLYAVDLGNGTKFEVLVTCPTNAPYRIFGVVGKGMYYFNTHASKEYVAEKLNIYPGDAAQMADFINTQTGTENEKTYGNYHEPKEHAALVHPVTGPIQRCSKEMYLDLFDVEVQPMILTQSTKPGAVALVCFQNHQLDSSQVGKRSSLVIGPSFTFNEGSIVNARLGDVPSRFQYPTYIWYV